MKETFAGPIGSTKSGAVERVNVNLPRPLLDDLRRLVPRSRRSEVIARATARELRRLKLAAALQEMERSPAWTEAHYAALADGESIETALRELRARGVSALPYKPKRKKKRG